MPAAVDRSVRRLRRAVRGVLSGARPAPPRVRDVDPRAPVRILYAPEIDGDPDPGEVVWGWVPFEDDPMQGKDRPVVIIGRRGDLLAAVPLTSRSDGRDGRVAIGPGPWDRRARPSYARVDRIVDLEPAAVRREGAILPRDRFDALVAEVVRRHRTEGGGHHRVP